MNTNFLIELVRKQLDETLSALQPLLKVSRPKRGWIATIRKGLGMTTRQLAKRVGISQSQIHKFEHSEIVDTISIQSLRKLAAAMKCEFVYALVPRASLYDILHQQARKIAKQKVQQIAHSMALEQQALTSEQIEKQIKELTKELLETSINKIWEEDAI